ncbi:MAG: Hsp20/alpha crystallin family protein [Spirochaetales bacterium]|nr:Hsp20/alpha crystallin family protein [Spirochaetales bacterium]
MRYVTNTRPVNTMDELLDSFFYGRPVPSQKPVYSSFPVDVEEQENSYVLVAELAGFKDEEVDITLNDGLLTITASRMKEAEKTDEPKEEVKYLLRERVSREFRRSFSLPKDADREAIKASLKDGLLYLAIGKKPEAKPVTIKIN